MEKTSFKKLPAQIYKLSRGRVPPERLHRNILNNESHARTARFHAQKVRLQEILRPFFKNELTDRKTSALRDPRFPPISLKELPHLQLGLSLLQNFEEVSNWEKDWELGKHGIQLEIHLDGSMGTAGKNQRRYSATFLPEVPVEQGWSKNETFDHLIAKSGYPSARNWMDLLQEIQDQDEDNFLKKKIKIIKYESIKGHLHHSDYAKKNHPQTSPE